MTEKLPKQINIYGEEEPIREPVKLVISVPADRGSVTISSESRPERWAQFTLRRDKKTKKLKLRTMSGKNPLEGDEMKQAKTQAKAILLEAYESGKFAPRDDQTELDLI